LQQVKLRARPLSSVSFRPGDPCRNAFPLHGTPPASAAWRFWDDLKTGDTREGFDV
jgi:hypothetical protein